MVYQEPTVYNQGLTLEDIENADGTWVTITNKMGSPHTSSFSESGFLFEYNRTLSLLHVAFYVKNTTPVNLSYGSYINLFDFNVDLPGTNANRLFNGEGIAIASEESVSSSVCLISPRPYDFVPGRSNMIYAQSFSTMRATIITGFNHLYAINKDLKAQFDAYLGL